MLKEVHPFSDTSVPGQILAANQQNIHIDLTTASYLRDHGFQGMNVLPGAVYLEMMALALARDSVEFPYRLQNIQFDRLFLLDGHEAISFSVHAEEQAGSRRLRVMSLSNDQEIEYASAQTALNPSQSQTTLDIGASLARFGPALSGSELYASLLKNGNAYQSSFQGIKQLYRNKKEALANVALPADLHADWEAYHLHPVLLDVCLQTVIATNLDLGQTFLVRGIKSLYINGALSTEAWVHTRITAADEGSGFYEADVTLFDGNGIPLLSMQGVQIQQLHDSQNDTTTVSNSTVSQDTINNRQIAVAATFTAEPIEPALSFWAKQWEAPASIAFAPYNQVFQQLLDPGSLLSANEDGFNVILLRLEDWMRKKSKLTLKVDESEKARLLAGKSAHDLPNGLEIAHLNPYESTYLFKEIFTDRAYLRHGITIEDGDCVIDVGANIGMFTLFTLAEANQAKIYSFEPSPPAFEALETNVALYGDQAANQVKVFNCGLADRDGEAQFTFYRHSSVFSGYHANEAADHTAVKTVIENALHQAGAADESSVMSLTEEMMTDRMDSETFACPIRTLSSIIDEEGINKIDLLKVDVEKSEREVLMGIEDRHWPIIHQIVLEVHDTEGPLIEEVTSLLKNRGFELEIEEEDLLEASGLYNIYGIRAGRHQAENGVRSDVQDLEQNVDDFIEAVTVFQKRAKVPTIVGVCPPSPDAVQLNEKFEHLTNHIRSSIQSFSNIELLHHQEILDTYPVADYYDAEADNLGHVPYTNDFFAAAGTAIIRKAHALTRKPYKVIVLDCDHTLWKGVCGEDGPAGVEIDAPHHFLQTFMREQQQQGMLLCLCSKNVEEDVLEVFAHKKDMPLQMAHIVAHRINWEPKSENIQALATELQLGLDSFIFIDDNPVECAEVKARCPEVLTLELPADTSTIPAFLEHTWAFDRTGITAVDAQRTHLYQQNIAREQFKEKALDFAAFIQALDLRVDISEPADHEFARMAQMTHRTNQFNVTTVRRSEAALKGLLQADRPSNLQARIVKVKDRFGDYGIVGTVLFVFDDEALVVDTLLLSCRVLGKGVEYQVLQYLGNLAVQQGKSTVIIPFVPSRKNKPAASFLEAVIDKRGDRSGLSHAYFGTLVEHSDGPTGEGVQYVFESEALVQLRFDPASVGKAEREESASGQERAITQGLNKTTQHFQTVAINYRTTRQIVKAIQVGAKRKRSTIPGVYIAPGDELEKQIATIWGDILQIDQVGATDHFFELGGTSLKAVQAISLLKEVLGIDIATVSLFDRTTVREVAALLRAHTQDGQEEREESVRQRGTQRRAMRGRRRK